MALSGLHFPSEGSSCGSVALQYRIGASRRKYFLSNKLILQIYGTESQALQITSH